MKSSKSKSCKGSSSSSSSSSSSAAAEECGVWLDVAALRAKKQQKAARPISKLLNPLARFGSYRVAVALNFTQTKMQMPATRQSTISSFFLPRSKKGNDTEDRSSPPFSGMSSTPLPEPHMGTKRKREMPFELPSELDNVSGHSSQVDLQDCDAHLESESADVCNDDNKEQQFFHLIWGYQSEEREPAEKRRPPEHIKDENVTDTQKDSNKAILHACRSADEVKEIPESLLHKDQTQRDSRQMHRSIFRGNRDPSSASLSAEGLHTQEPLKARVSSEKNASFQRPTRPVTEKQHTMKCPLKSHKGSEIFEQRHQWSPVKRKDKENSRPTSPGHNIELSPVKPLCPSPAKLCLDFNRKCWTPKKSIRESQVNEEDSFAMLFTQDSEGFRVIANRSKWPRCPLKDQTNSLEGRDYQRIASVTSLETENSDPEPEMLFTQDSQGNMVIKH